MTPQALTLETRSHLAVAECGLEKLEAIRLYPGRGNVRNEAIRWRGELAQVLRLIRHLKPSTAAANESARLARDAAQLLVLMATGDAPATAFDLARAMNVLGKAHERARLACYEKRRPGRPPGQAPTKARIERVRAERPSASLKEIADAAFSSPEYVRKVRARRT